MTRVLDRLIHMVGGVVLICAALPFVAVLIAGAILIHGAGCVRRKEV